MVNMWLDSCVLNTLPPIHAAPTVTFTSPNYEVLENNGPAVVCVRKDLDVVGSFFVTISSRESVPRDAEGIHSATIHNFILLRC